MVNLADFQQNQTLTVSVNQTILVNDFSNNSRYWHAVIPKNAKVKRELDAQGRQVHILFLSEGEFVVTLKSKPTALQNLSAPPETRLLTIKVIGD